MTEYILDEDQIAKEFDEGQIQGFMKDLGFSRIETLIYLWAYNHFFTCVADVAKDNGRPMYRELARMFSKLLCVKKSYENVTQYDLMTENYNLRRAIKDIYILAERGISNQMFTPETAVLSRIKGDCYLALNEKDEK